METRAKINSRQIEKIKVTDKGVLIVWTETIITDFEQPDGQKAKKTNKLTHTVDGDFLPHKDLLDAFKMLRKPLIEICELGDFTHFDKYQIRGVSYSGQQDDAKVVITGSKEIDWSGEEIVINTPPTPLYDQEEYTGAKKLDSACTKLNAEAWAYVDDGKHAEDPQLKLSFEPA